MRKIGVSEYPLVKNGDTAVVVSPSSIEAAFSIDDSGSLLQLSTNSPNFAVEDVLIGGISLTEQLVTLKAHIEKIGGIRKNLMEYSLGESSPLEIFGKPAANLISVNEDFNAIHRFAKSISAKFPSNMMYIVDGNCSDQNIFPFEMKYRTLFNSVTMHVVNEDSGDEETCFYGVRFLSHYLLYGQPAGENYRIFLETPLSSDWLEVCHFSVSAKFSDASRSVRLAQTQVEFDKIGWAGTIFNLGITGNAQPVPYSKILDPETAEGTLYTEIVVNDFDWNALAVSGCNSFNFAFPVESSDIKLKYGAGYAYNPYYDLNCEPSHFLLNNDASDATIISLRCFPLVPFYRPVSAVGISQKIPFQIHLRFTQPKIRDFVMGSGPAYYGLGSEADLVALATYPIDAMNMNRWMRNFFESMAIITSDVYIRGNAVVTLGAVWDGQLVTYQPQNCSGLSGAPVDGTSKISYFYSPLNSSYTRVPINTGVPVSFRWPGSSGTRTMYADFLKFQFTYSGLPTGTKTPVVITIRSTESTSQYPRFFNYKTRLLPSASGLIQVTPNDKLDLNPLYYAWYNPAYPRPMNYNAALLPTYAAGNDVIAATLFEIPAEYKRYVSIKPQFRNFLVNTTDFFNNKVWTGYGATGTYGAGETPIENLLTKIVCLDNFVYSLQTGNYEYFIPCPSTDLASLNSVVLNPYKGKTRWASIFGYPTAAASNYAYFFLYSWTGVRRFQKYFLPTSTLGKLSVLVHSPAN